jgi:hypothetical protein
MVSLAKTTGHMILIGDENCRTKTSFIYTVENIETSYIVFCGFWGED